MAVYTGTLSSAAGAMISALDTELVKNANWIIYDDAAGTNKKVYECTVVGFGSWYLVVDDNYSGYYTTVITDAWDADAHTATGDVTTTLYHSKDGTLYRVWLNDTRVIISDRGGTNNLQRLSYHGLTVPHPGCDYSLITCGGTSTSYDSSNHLGTDGTGHGWRCLWDPYGTANVTCYILGRVTGSDSAYRIKRDKNGFLHLRPTTVYAYGGTNRLNIGFLDGVVVTGTTSNRHDNYDIIVADGTEWEYCADSSFGVFVRMT